MHFTAFFLLRGTLEKEVKAVAQAALQQHLRAVGAEGAIVTPYFGIFWTLLQPRGEGGSLDYAHHIPTAGMGGPHCTEIDLALSFGVVIVKMTDLSKTESRDFFGIILDQKNSKSYICYQKVARNWQNRLNF